MQRVRKSEGDQQNEINLTRGKQHDWDSVEQHPSVQDPGAHVQPKQKRTRDQPVCLRPEVVDVIDLSPAHFNHREGDSQEPYILTNGNRHTEHEQRHGSVHQGEPQCQKFPANSVDDDETYHRAVTDVSRGNTALVKIDQFLLHSDDS